MSNEERLERVQRRFDEMFTSEASTLMVIKDAAIAVLQRDGSADWARIETHIAELLPRTPGETGRKRLEAAIAHLQKLAAKPI